MKSRGWPKSPAFAIVDKGAALERNTMVQQQIKSENKNLLRVKFIFCTYH